MRDDLTAILDPHSHDKGWLPLDRHREVNYIDRPFPLSEARDHLLRLESWGFTFRLSVSLGHCVYMISLTSSLADSSHHCHLGGP